MSTAPGSLRDRFARGILWSLSGAVCAQGATLVGSIFIARILGRSSFGEFGIIQSTVLMLGTFADLGQGLTTTKYLAEMRGVAPERAGRVIALSEIVAGGGGLLLSLVVMLAAPWIARAMLDAPHLTNELRIASVLTLLTAMTSVYTGAFAGLEAFRMVATVNLVRALVSLPLLVVGTWVAGVTGAVWALVVSAALVLAFGRVALRRSCRERGITPRVLDAFRERHVLWRFSVPALLSGLVAPPAIWYCNTLLAAQPDGYIELGLLTAARQWQGVLTFLPQIAASVTLPILASFGSEKGDGAQERSIEMAHLLTQAFVWSVAVPLVALSPWIMSFYGRGFSDGATTLALLVGGTAIGYFGNVLGSVLIARGWMWLGAAQNALWGLVVLATTFATVSTMRSAGLALGFVVGYTFLMVSTALLLMSRGLLPAGLGWRAIWSGIAMLLILAVRWALPVTAPFAALGVVSTVLLALTGFIGGTTPGARRQALGMLRGWRSFAPIPIRT